MIYRIDSFPNANSALYGDAVGLLGLNVFDDHATYTNLFITVDGGASGVTISNAISPGKWRMDVLIANGANTGYYNNGVLRTNWVSGSSSFSGLYINSLPPYYYNNTMNLAEMWIRSENGSNHIAADWNYVTNKYANTNF